MSLNWYIDHFSQKNLSPEQRRRAVLLAQEKMRNRVPEYTAAQQAVEEARKHVEESAEQRAARIESERQRALERERARLAEIERLKQIAKAEADRIERERVQQLNNRKSSANSELEREIEAARSARDIINARLNMLKENADKLKSQNERCAEVKFDSFSAPNVSELDRQIADINREIERVKTAANDSTRIDNLIKIQSAIKGLGTIEAVETQMKGKPSAKSHDADVSAIDARIKNTQSTLKALDRFLTEFAKLDAIIGSSPKFVELRNKLRGFYDKIALSDCKAVEDATGRLDEFVKELQSIARYQNDLDAIHKINCLLDEIQSYLRTLRGDNVEDEQQIQAIKESAEAHEIYSKGLERGLFINDFKAQYSKFLRGVEEGDKLTCAECIEKMRVLDEKSSTVYEAKKFYTEVLERRNIAAAKVNKLALRDEFSFEYYRELAKELEEEIEQLEIERLRIYRDDTFSSYDYAMRELGYAPVTQIKEVDEQTGAIQCVYAKRDELGTAMVIEIDQYDNRKDYAVGIELSDGNKKYSPPKDNVASVCKKTKNARKEEVKRQIAIDQVEKDDLDVSPDEDNEPEFEPILFDSVDNAEEFRKYLETVGGELYEENGELKLRKKTSGEVGGGVSTGAGAGQGASAGAKVGQGTQQQRELKIPK